MSEQKCIRVWLNASLLLCLWASGDASGLALQCPAIAPDTAAKEEALAIGELDRLLNEHKLGGTACSSGLCNRVTQLEGLSAPDDIYKSAAILFGELTQSAISSVGNSVQVGQPFRAELTTWYEMTFGASREQIASLPGAAWQLNGHTLFSGQPNQIDVDAALTTACGPNGLVRDCRQGAFLESSCAVAHAVLQRRIHRKLLEPNRAMFAHYLQGLNDRWDAYRRDGRSLYPWEIAFNERFVWDYADVEGFAGPPSQQWVFLHPDIALVGNIESGSDGDGLEETLVVELIGRDRWSWGGPQKVTLKSLIGLSTIAAWNGSDDISYGFMTHWRPNLAAGLTYGSIDGDDRFSLVLSVDLGKALTDKSTVRNAFKDLLLERSKAKQP